MIVPLTDEEISAAIQRSGWILSTPESAREFHRLATALAHSLEVKNEPLYPTITRSSGNANPWRPGLPV